MLFVLPLWVMPHSMGAACGYAILEGEREERTIAGVETVYMVFSTVLSLSSIGPSDLSVNIVATSVEFTVALWVALGSGKLWPMGYASVVLVALMTLVAASVLRTELWAYGTANFVWNYVEILVLVVGTWRTARARRRGAERPSLQPLKVVG